MKWLVGWLAVLFLLAGCHTTSPLVDWDRRIGHYSYDLALADLGVPVRSTTLNNGSIVADWLAQSGKIGADEEIGYETEPFLESPFPNGTPPTPNTYLRLTFGPDQQLTGWKRYHQYYE
jgi:hypothetical protein